MTMGECPVKLRRMIAELVEAIFPLSHAEARAAPEASLDKA